MIAEVIPYTRTIRGKDSFDYGIPEGIHVSAGDIVQISFRSKSMFGLVWAVKPTSEAKKLQHIVEVVPYTEWQQKERRDFLQWFAEYYVVSLPTAFRAVQFPLLRKPRKHVVENPSFVSEASATPRVDSSAITQIIPGKTHLVRFDQRADCLQLYRGIIARAKKHVLVIVPEHVDSVTMQFALACDRPAYILSSDASPSEWHSVIDALHEEQPIVCIGTKRSVFLPFDLFDVVIMDSEESRSHKQFDLNPRYHVRTVVEWLEQHGSSKSQQQPTVVFASQAPSIDCFVHAQERQYVQIDLPRVTLESHVIVVDMEHERQGKNYSWFSEPLVVAVRASKKSLLFLNRVGFYGSALCKDCSTLLPSDATVCTACRGSNIRYMRKGTAQLEQELRTLFPGKTVLRIDRDQRIEELTSAQVQKADIIIGTEKALHMLPLSYFDCIGVLSVDHLLVYPHFRSNERVFQLLTALCSIPVPTFIQTSAPHHPVIRFVVAGAYTAFATQEVDIRKILNLPPFGERIILLNTKTRESRSVNALPPLANIGPDVVVDRQ